MREIETERERKSERKRRRGYRNREKQGYLQIVNMREDKEKGTSQYSTVQRQQVLKKRKRII